MPVVAAAPGSSPPRWRSCSSGASATAPIVTSACAGSRPRCPRSRRSPPPARTRSRCASPSRPPSRRSSPLPRRLAQRPDAPCAAYTIESEEPFAVAGSLTGAGRPDAWITDSALWVGRANAVSRSNLVPAAPFASSPVLVAMNDDAASALGSRLGWADLLGGSVAVRLPDPNRSAIARTVLGVAASSLPAPRLRALVTTSAATAGGSVSLDGLARARGGAAVVSQAQLLGWKAAHPEEQLAAVAPAEGAPALEYSLLPLTTDAAKARLVAALGGYLSAAETQKLLQDSGFRTSAGNPKDPSPLYGQIRVTGTPDGALPLEVASLWSASSPKTQALLAVDVSGSMLERTDRGTRLATVQKSTVRALAAVSPNAIASLWVYSLHVGSRADDFRQLRDYAGLGVPEQPRRPRRRRHGPGHLRRRRERAL